MTMRGIGADEGVRAHTVQIVASRNADPSTPLGMTSVAGCCRSGGGADEGVRAPHKLCDHAVCRISTCKILGYLQGTNCGRVSASKLNTGYDYSHEADVFDRVWSAAAWRIRRGAVHA